MGFLDRFLKPPPKPTTAGRSYKCSNCGNPVFFRNSVCLKCQTALGYEPKLARIVSIAPNPETDEWHVIEETGKIDGISPAYRRCANLNTPAACNWLLSDHGIGAKDGLCIACRLNHTIPDLSDPENGVLWGRFEEAKRRMVSTLLALEIPVLSKDEDPEKGLAFDFLRSH